MAWPAKAWRDNMFTLSIIQVLLTVVLIWMLIPSFITNSLIIGFLGKLKAESEEIKTV